MGRIRTKTTTPDAPSVPQGLASCLECGVVCRVHDYGSIGQALIGLSPWDLAELPEELRLALELSQGFCGAGPHQIWPDENNQPTPGFFHYVKARSCPPAALTPVSPQTGKPKA